MRYIKNISKLRRQRLAARNVLKRAGRLSFKPQSFAKWADITYTKNGSILIQIQHDDASGVTPQMLKWWFEHLGCVTTWNGKDFSSPKVILYHLWHHRDHVAVTPLTDAPDGTRNLGFLKGADSRIHEQFNEFHDLVHYTMHTIRLDEQEFTFRIMIGPIAGLLNTHTRRSKGGFLLRRDQNRTGCLGYRLAV